MEKVSENMLKRTLHRGDPLLGLVEDRFRLLRQCPRSDDDDEEVFDRRLDELRRRIRRLDERIMRTVRPPCCPAETDPAHFELFY